MGQRLPKVERHIETQDTADDSGASFACIAHLLPGCALLQRKGSPVCKTQGTTPVSFRIPQILTAKAHSAPKQCLQTQSLHLIIPALCCKMICTINSTTRQTPARRICRMRALLREKRTKSGKIRWKEAFLVRFFEHKKWTRLKRNTKKG
jgi:hypothetical protein